jgi:hypothetical protein
VEPFVSERNEAVPSANETTPGLTLVGCPCCGLKPLDEAIKPLVHVLNAHGLPTDDSCCGHRGKPRETRAYVAFDADEFALHAFMAALRRLSIDLCFCIEVDWDRRFDETFKVLHLTLRITDRDGRAPKSAALASLASELDTALGAVAVAWCDAWSERKTASSGGAAGGWSREERRRYEDEMRAAGRLPPVRN